MIRYSTVYVSRILRSLLGVSFWCRVCRLFQRVCSHSFLLLFSSLWLVPPFPCLHLRAKYIETTIFFADIKGFTKWCANRQPVEVFTLLETLYGEFDKVAQRRRVYKVETVGKDLYTIVSFTSS